MTKKKSELTNIVGANNVSDAPETLDAYSRDQSFVLPRKPRIVIKPKNVGEVQEIVKWANQMHTPLVPISSGPPHFRGDTVPGLEGTVIVDLSGMKRIIKIDRRNRIAMIEPGVIFSQLQLELAKEGLKPSLPLMPRSNKSVMTSLLEREPTLIPRYNWALPDPLRCLEVVWGNGEKLWTGDAGMRGSLERQKEFGMAQSVPMGPLSVDYHRIVSGSQGTMGIVTWATVKCEVLPQIHKFFFVISEKLNDLIGFAYKILKFRYGDELLFLNGSNLAYMLGEGTDQTKTLREKLPQWVLIIGVAGRQWLPDERVKFQEKDITDIAKQFGLQLMSAIPAVSNGQIPETLLNPSQEPYWKLRYQGGCQDIFFLTTLNRTPEFVETIYSASREAGYEPSKIGIYIQPVHQGVGCHCEFVLPFDPGSQGEVTKAQRLLTTGSEALVKQGAFFSRPYGVWADMVYSKDAQAAKVLNKIKGIFDPNNVLNPGKLCFHV